MKKILSFGLATAGIVASCTSIASAESIYVNRDSAAYYLQRGKEDQSARKYASAWKYFENAARFDARDAEAQLAIAEVCQKMNRMAPAVKALEAAAQLRPADNEIQWKLVQHYFNFGQHDKVIAMVPALYPKVADSKGWAYMLGKSYHATQNYGKAIYYLQTSLKENPKDAEAAYLIGRMYVQMTNYAAAIPYYQRAFSIDSSFKPSRTYEYALVLATAGKFDESIKTFQDAIERGYKPRDDFYMNMAYTMADAKKTKEAIAILKELLSRRPQDLGLLNGIAGVCFHSGQYKEAIAYWDDVLGFDDKNARVVYQIGTAYIKMGNEKDGQALCDRAIQMDPSLAVLKHAKQLPL